MYQHHSLLRRLFNPPAYFRSNVIRRYKKKIKEAIKIRTGDPGKQVELMHTNDRPDSQSISKRFWFNPYLSALPKKGGKKTLFVLHPYISRFDFFFKAKS